MTLWLASSTEKPVSTHYDSTQRLRWVCCKIHLDSTTPTLHKERGEYCHVLRGNGISSNAGRLKEVTHILSKRRDKLGYACHNGKKDVTLLQETSPTIAQNPTPLFSLVALRVMTMNRTIAIIVRLLMVHYLWDHRRMSYAWTAPDEPPLHES